MKKCTTCLLEKSLEEFHNCSSKPSGKFSSCKVCRNQKSKERAERIGQDVLYQRALQTAGPEKYKAKSLAYREDNRCSARKRARKWNADNRERKRESARADYQRNKAVYLERAKAWAEANPKKRTRICLDYMARKKLEDPAGYMASVIARKALARVLIAAKLKKSSKTFETVGYSRGQFIAHMETLFSPGMSWANHGEWHIDHVIPVSELIRCGVTDPAKINALANLRPLWADENLSKHNSFELAPCGAAEITRASRCRQKKSQTTALTC